MSIIEGMVIHLVFENRNFSINVYSNKIKKSKGRKTYAKSPCSLRKRHKIPHNVERAQKEEVLFHRN